MIDAALRNIRSMKLKTNGFCKNFILMLFSKVKTIKPKKDL